MPMNPSPDIHPDVTPLHEPPTGMPELAHPSPFFAIVRPHHDEQSRIVDHVSNVEYLRWLDRAAELHMDSMGWTREALLETGRMWFVARHEIDYLAEAHAGDELHLATWVRDLRRAKSWRETVIWRGAADSDDEPCMVCSASTLWVLVDLQTRRPCRVPPDMAEVLSPLL
jgi:acyl-CoA thioester hydrolase